MNRPDRDPDEPTQYLVAHVREVLAGDERVAALDINVRIVGSAVYLTGTVATAQRRDAAELVVRELLPQYQVHNQLALLSQDAPRDAEDVS